MKITDEAKLLIKESLASNDCDCLQVTLERSCCGTSFRFTPIKLPSDKNPESVNDISVLMDSRTRAITETITLAVKDGELIIKDDKPSCCC